ncbi:unnamed protein product [Kluyveromyces dobzhanskii CBS 2104]|uniref:WGS project CCBQ000000000 data, contig 00102 n=1 Tax=Kluyveromyces dobzhanskii CBS 2104 TaxID=1427455 RepID=A0A0A8L601_9SACH|nr:unnamed protein product [Kluyveromyces dobzhanskii CBS 2104]
MSNTENATYASHSVAEPVVEPVVAAAEPVAEVEEPPVHAQTVPVHDQVVADQHTSAEPVYEDAYAQETPKSTSKFASIYSNSTLHYVTRGVQLLFTILVLALTATSINKAPYSSSRTNFGLAVSVMTLAYFLAGYLFFTFASASTRTLLPVTVVFAIEAILMIFWFCAFVVLADFFSGSCYPGYIFSFTSAFYGISTDDSSQTSCRSGKAAAAFAAFTWLAFVISFVVYIFNVLRPVLSHYGSSGWLKKNTVDLNPFTFLSGSFVFNDLAEHDYNHEKGVPENTLNTTDESSVQVPATTV